MQTNDLKTERAIQIVEKIGRKLHSIPDIDLKIVNHFDDIFRKKNEGYKLMKNFTLNNVSEGPIAKLNEDEKMTMKNAPMTSTAPERIFSMHKGFYRDNRRRFKFENVKKFVTCKCVLNQVSYKQFKMI